MRLPAGATGFGVHPVDPAARRTFASACHHAARTTGGAAAAVGAVDSTAGFHSVEIRRPGDRVAVLRHAVLPWVAFARPRRAGDVELVFVDRPDLAVAVSGASAARVLTVDELATPLSRVDTSALGRDELAQIAYWRPATVGELLFNHWD